MKVYQLKEKLQEFLEKLEGYDQDAELKTYTNTYWLHGDEFIATYDGFVSLDTPVEEEEDEYL